jgi:ATP-binding cassette subfamily F protein uup
MPVLITCQSIVKRFGLRPLFRGLSLTVSDGERIGVIGPNGAGKTTLIRILAGCETPDEGTVAPRRHVRIGHVAQEPSFDAGSTVLSVLESAVAPLKLEHAERNTRLNVALGKTGFLDHHAEAATLSGGWRKRLAIARELIREPDLLLMDEPTNHLDLPGIEWLENLLSTASFACVAVSHDRYFLENVATDMVEINRVYPDGLLRKKGSYSEFLLKRDEFLASESNRQEALENVVRREVEWLRRGAKARTTKSKARIAEANRLISELSEAEARARGGSVQIDFTGSERRTKRLLDAESVAKSLGGRNLFSDVTFTLSPGTRMGLVGPNGCGKTTLLRILAGEIRPDAGRLQQAEGLQAIYFDQHREQLDFDVPLRRALSPHGDSVIYRGRPIHVAGWAKRFLFRSEQLETPVGQLSGGERARVVIARLMLRRVDLLLLDEPTNDLDIPTLEILEESLLDFPGAIVLVTHDRYMLDRVSTAVLGIDGRGGAGMFADYTQWERARDETLQPVQKSAPGPVEKDVAPRKRLSYMENREWEQIELTIESAERVLAERQRGLQASETVRDPRKLQEAYGALEEAQAEVDRLYARWAELEEKVR